MTVRDEIYKTLANDPVLNGMLARSNVPGMEGAPAIYETWAAEDTPFPYINLTWNFATTARHWVKRRGSLTLDIFMNNADTITTERIAKRIIELLDHREFFDLEDGSIEVYLDTNTDYIEDDPEIVHHYLDFTVDHWRQQFISTIQGG